MYNMNELCTIWMIHVEYEWAMPYTNESHVLQCATVCCSVLQCVAVCCSVLQCVAHTSATSMPHSESATSVLQCVAMCCSAWCLLQLCCTHLSDLNTKFWINNECVAACCNVLQCVVFVAVVLHTPQRPQYQVPNQPPHKAASPQNRAETTPAMAHVQNESWQTYECVAAHIWMSHGRGMNESWHIQSTCWYRRFTPKSSRKTLCMDQSWHTYGWVMAYLWMSHVTCTNESQHTYECVIWHTIAHICLRLGTHNRPPNTATSAGDRVETNPVWMSHNKQMHEAWRASLHIYASTFEWVLAHVWTNMKASWRTCEWIMAHVWMRNGARMNASWHTYECVMAHIWMHHGTHDRLSYTATYPKIELNGSHMSASWCMYNCTYE